jgi:hypothetical protein
VSLYGAAVRLQVGIGAFSIVYLIFFLVERRSNNNKKKSLQKQKREQIAMDFEWLISTPCTVGS